jgi:hypothetical protein
VNRSIGEAVAETNSTGEDGIEIGRGEDMMIDDDVSPGIIRRNG